MNDQVNTSEVFSFKEKVAYSSNGIVSKNIIRKQTGNVSLFAFDKAQELNTLCHQVSLLLCLQISHMP